MKNKKTINIVVLICMINCLFSIISCDNDKDKTRIKVSIEDPENILPDTEELVGKKSDGMKYIIEIVEPDSKIDYKVLIKRPENNIDQNMVIINPTIPNATENGSAIPVEVSTEIKEFIKKIENNEK